MADMTDVYVRIKYKKDGKIYEDDILEDIDMYDTLTDMEYNGIDYEVENKLIMRAYGRNYYPSFFEEESEIRDYLFEISKEKGIDDIYHIFCEYSYVMGVIRYGIIHTDIINREVTVDIRKTEDYTKIFEEIMEKSYPKLKEKYDDFLDGELEEEVEYKFEEKMDEIMGKYSMKEFKKFLTKINLENLV